MARVVRPAERAFLLVVMDAVGAVGAVLLGLWTWSFTAGFQFSADFLETHAIWFLSVPIWVVALAPTRHMATMLDVRDTLIGIARAGAVLFFCYLVAFFYAGDVLPRLVAMYVLWDSVALTVAGRLVVLWGLTRDQFARRLVIIGDAATMAATVPLFDQPGLRDAELLGVVTDRHDAAAPGPYLGAPIEVDQIAQRVGATEIVVASEGDLAPPVVERLLRSHEAGVDVIGMAQLYEQVLRRVPVRRLSPAWLLTHFLGAEGPREASPLAKRVLDLLVALPMGLAGLVVGMVIAAAIKLDSRGPVFYRQVRVGRAGRTFELVKFRTMRTDAEAQGPQWSTQGDPRITRVGRILRRTHLDELPNLWSVLRGELSMVGPRPERPEFVTMLERTVPFYRVRLTVTPGLTGWAQVNQEYADSVEDAAAKLEYDLYYARHRSVRFDIEILVNTIGRILGWRGR